MKYPSRHEHDTPEDWQAARLRHEERAEFERDLQREREPKEYQDPAPVKAEKAWEGAWEAWNEENFRTNE